MIWNYRPADHFRCWLVDADFNHYALDGTPVTDCITADYWSLSDMALDTGCAL